MSLFIRTFQFMELFSVTPEQLDYAKLIILYKVKSINLISKWAKVRKCITTNISRLRIYIFELKV